MPVTQSSFIQRTCRPAPTSSLWRYEYVATPICTISLVLPTYEISCQAIFNAVTHELKVVLEISDACFVKPAHLLSSRPRLIARIMKALPADIFKTGHGVYTTQCSPEACDRLLAHFKAIDAQVHTSHDHARLAA